MFLYQYNLSEVDERSYEFFSYAIKARGVKPTIKVSIKRNQRGLEGIDEKTAPW